MKKMLILAMAALPLFGIAQDKEKPATTSTATAAPSKTKENKFAIENPEVIFIELVAGINSAGAQTIRADFGREIAATLNDKELAAQLNELRTMSFPSMPDAMNYLASTGYKFQQNYAITDKEGKTETHFVFEKRMPRKPGQEGVARPATRPERPETGAKPADVKPVEKTPTAKPAEKGKK